MFYSKKIKIKKIGFGAFKNVQVSMVGDFFKLCANCLSHSKGTIYHVWTSKKPKKIISSAGSTK